MLGVYAELSMAKDYRITGSLRSCSVVVSFPIEQDTNQGSNPGGGKKKKSLAGNPKNSGRAPAYGTCGWFGPSYQGVVAVSANTVVGPGYSATL